MLSYAKSVTARHRLNGFKNSKTQPFNSRGDIKWACFQKKWSVPLRPAVWTKSKTQRFCLRRFEYLFNFDSMFEIHDDVEVLKRMGMAFGLESGRCSPEQLKIARTLVPKALQPYVTGVCLNLNHMSFQNPFWSCFDSVCCIKCYRNMIWRVLSCVSEWKLICLSDIVEMAQGAINQLIGELSHVATWVSHDLKTS